VESAEKMLKPQNEIGIARAATTTIQLDSVSDTRIGHVSCWLINKSVFLLAPLQTKNPMSKFLPPIGVLSINHTIFQDQDQGQGHFYMAGEKKGSHNQTPAADATESSHGQNPQMSGSNSLASCQ